ncbi:MAG TPA: hypothetical protein VMV44_01950 [Rectinemataceae bacterium]|nr:hypothetical protein [Rectinemataceae bacterium]
MRGTFGRGILIAFASLILLGLASLAFVYRPRAEIVVAIDSAFAAIRPGLVAKAAERHVLGNRLDLILVPEDKAVPTLLQALATKKLHPRAIAASPLVARALVEGAARNNAQPPAPVISLDWSPAPEGGAASPAASILSDPLPGARKLGSILARAVALVARGSSAASPVSPPAEGGLVWESGPARSDTEREAFAEGWTAEAGSPPFALDLQPGQANSDGLLRQTFAMDLRAVFIDAGDFTPMALDLAAGKVGIIAFASGAADEVARAWPSASLALVPDDAAFAAFLRSPACLALKGRHGIPSVIRILPAAAALPGIDLGALIADGTR